MAGGLPEGGSMERIEDGPAGLWPPTATLGAGGIRGGDRLGAVA